LRMQIYNNPFSVQIVNMINLPNKSSFDDS